MLAWLIAGAIGTYAGPSWAQAPALPTGGDVVAGQAAIAATGNMLNVNASTSRAIVNWDSFNVGAGNIANFNLPDANSAILNRVTAANMPSTIAGAVNSNGNVYLVNPSGIMVTSSGMVNTNGFTASTFDIANDAFMAGGALTFADNGSSASIVNNGSIQTGAGGAHLIANEIANNGTIASTGGNITLSGGGTVTLDNGVTYVQPSLETLTNGISPTAGLIQNTGTIRATGAATSGGEVYLVNPNGKIMHDGTIAAQEIAANGNSTGGHVQLEADEITLTENASIDVTGTHGGGDVLVGGDWKGSGPMHQATTVTMEAGAEIDASATESGDGGKIVMWSDVLNVDAITEVFGTLIAQGGELFGDGGQIETSGKELSIGETASVNTGAGGLWLLDPTDIIIADSGGTVTPGTIEATLNGGGDVTLTTAGAGSDNGDIFVNDDITKTSGGTSTLELIADSLIGIYDNITDASGNGLNIILTSDQLDIGAANITTGGGDITIQADTELRSSTSDSLFAAGSGDVTLLSDYLVRDDQKIIVDTSGSFVLAPVSSAFNAGQIGGQLDLSGTFDSGTDTFRGVSDANGLGFNNLSSLGGLTIGKSGMTSAIATYTPWEINGPISFIGGGVTVNDAITANGDILLSASGLFATGNVSRQTLTSNNGNISIIADSDANGSGQLDLDYLTLNAGSGDILIRGESFSWSTDSDAVIPIFNGTGSFTFEPSDASFAGNLDAGSWLKFNTDASAFSSFTLGKMTNSSVVNLSDRSYESTSITVAGPITIYGTTIQNAADITSTADGDILFRATGSTGSDILLNSGSSITKSAGSGTLTLQGHGRVSNQGTIQATGSGELNVIMWSDYDNDNNDGGVSQMGTISTGGGHVWLGGSNSNGGSATWNGLTVGNGPSIGTSGANFNALDLYGNVTTGGGDFLAWAGTGNTAGGGWSGIVTDSDGMALNTGAGDVTLIADQIIGPAGNSLIVRSTGHLTIAPDAGDFGGTLEWLHNNNSAALNLGGSVLNYLLIENYDQLTGLTLGSYDGMSGISISNSSPITINSGINIAGPVTLRGGEVTLNSAVNITAADADLRIEANDGVTVGFDHSTNGGNVVILADRDGNGGEADIRIDGNIATSGGGIWVGGNFGDNGAGTSWDPGDGNLITVGDGFAHNGAAGAENAGVWADTVFNTSGGNVAIYGYGVGADGAGLSTGVWLQGDSITTGGGDLTIVGQQNSASTVQHGSGILLNGGGQPAGLSITTGGGDVSITGETLATSNTVRGAGTWIGRRIDGTPSTGPVTIETTGGDITLTGVAERASGTFWSLGLALMSGLDATRPDSITISSGAGDIALSGTGAAADVGDLSGGVYFELNAASNASFMLETDGGALSLTGDAGGSGDADILFINNRPGDLSIGDADTGAVTFTGDWQRLDVGSADTALQTAGALTFVSDAATFAQPFSLDGLSLSGSPSSITVGLPTNTANVTIDQSLNSTGPISIYGGAVDLNGNLTAGGDIILQANTTDLQLGGSLTQNATGTSTATLRAQRHVNLETAASVTATGGAMNTQLWADTDADGDGIVFVESAGISTGGGNLTFGQSGQTATIGGESVLVGGDVFFQRGSAQSLNTGGGAFELFGETIISNTSGLTLNTGGGNAHFHGLLDSGNAYEFVDRTGSGGSGSWNAARTDAINGTGGGSALGDSYLINITSRLENAIGGLVAGYQGAWIGAHRPDPAGSYDWQWADGPEAGQLFFTQSGSGSGGGGSAQTGWYANFASGEPNGALDANGENAGQFFGSEGLWNDLRKTNTYSATQTGQYDVLGFVRETNLAASSLSIDTGSGNLTVDGGVGTRNAFSTIDVTSSGTIINGAGTASTGIQDYSSSLTINGGVNPVELTATTINVAGPLTVRGGNITANTNLISTAEGADTLLQGTGAISIAASTSLRTNNGDITLWADSDASNEGHIAIGNNVTFNSVNGLTTSGLSTGGNIVMAGGGDDGTNGGAASDGRPDGFARSASNPGIELSTTNAGSVSIYSGGGDVILRGASSNNESPIVTNNVGIQQFGGLIVDSGTGAIQMVGESVNHYGINLNQASTADTLQLELMSAATTGDAIFIRGVSQNQLGLVFNFDSDKELKATGGGNIVFEGVGGGSNHGIFLQSIDVLANSGNITIDGGANGIRNRNTGNNFGFKAGSDITASSSDILFVGDVIALDAGGTRGAINTSGNVTLESDGNSFTAAFDTSNVDISGSPSSVTLGRATNAADITIGRAITTGGTLLVQGGNVAINGQVTAGTTSLQATGAVSQSAVIDTTSLVLRDATSVTLSDNGNAITTLAADSVGSFSIINSGALTVGTVDSVSGIAATGDINITTLNGNLTISQDVQTTSTTADAIILNAGRNAGAGSATGGNIIVSGSPTVTTGSGGRATLFTGSIADSTGLTDLIGSGSGRFRYNSDETAANYSLALGTGLFGIYRQQPTVDVTVDNQTMTYGDSAPTWTYTLNNNANGDSTSQIFASPDVTVTGTTSTSGNFTATAHSTSATGMGTSQLGYAVGTLTDGTLTVNQRQITTPLVIDDKVYDGTTSATFSATANNAVAGDLIDIGATANFVDKNAGTGKTVNVTGLNLSGVDAGNYSLANTSDTSTADITPRTITITGLAADSKVYDGTTAATIDHSGVTFNGIISGDELTASSTTGTFDNKHVGNGKTVTLSGTSYGGADLLNYDIVNQATTTGNVTPRSVSVRGLAANNRVYDGTTAATVDHGGVSFDGMIAGDDLTVAGTVGTFADKNVEIAKSVNLSGSVYGGADVGNYTIADQATSTADITPRLVTVSGLSAGSKIYDGTTDAVVDSSGVTFNGMVGGDELTISDTVGTFTDKNVGTNKVVNLSGSDYGGADVGNYTFTDQATTTGDITPRSVTVSGLTGVERVYDGTTSVAIDHSGAAFSGMVAGDDLTASSTTGTLADRHVGTNKVATLAGTIYGGADVGNYTFLAQPTATATITPRSLVVNLQGQGSKVYDGTSSISLSGITPSLSGIIGGDDVAVAAGNVTGFVNKNAGSNKDVVYNGFGLSGVDIGNYFLQSGSAPSTASITPRSVVVSGLQANSRVYDGTTVTTVDHNGVAFAGIVSGDELTASGTTGTFANKNVGSNKPVTLSGTAYGGADVGNYSFTDQVTSTADITHRSLVINGIAANNKTYDGDTVATVDLSGIQWNGLVAGDDVSASVLGNFDDKNVGSNKNVQLVITEAGADLGNYSITKQQNASADISRLSSVTWVGGLTGDWSDPANWAGGAIPDLGNVANIVIPNGVTPIFDDQVSGPVEIDSLAGGNLQVGSGTLNVANDATVDNFTQNGGIFNVGGLVAFHQVLFNGGSLNVTGNATGGDWTQNGGTAGFGGDLDVDNYNQTDGDATVSGSFNFNTGTLDGGTLGVTGNATGGDWTQNGGTAGFGGDLDVDNYNQTDGDATVSGSFSFNTGTLDGGTLGVTGNAMGGDWTQNGGTAGFGGDLDVDNYNQTDGDATVGGSFNFNTGTLDGGTLGVTGNAMGGDWTQNGGTAGFGGDLDVDNYNQTDGGTTVDGSFSFNTGTLDGGTLGVTGNASGGDWTQNGGTAGFGGDLDVDNYNQTDGDTTVGGTLTFDTGTIAGGSLHVSGDVSAETYNQTGGVVGIDGEIQVQQLNRVAGELDFAAISGPLADDFITNLERSVTDTNTRYEEQGTGKPQNPTSGGLLNSLFRLATDVFERWFNSQAGSESATLQTEVTQTEVEPNAARQEVFIRQRNYDGLTNVE